MNEKQRNLILVASAVLAATLVYRGVADVHGPALLVALATVCITAALYFRLRDKNEERR